MKKIFPLFLFSIFVLSACFGTSSDVRTLTIEHTFVASIQNYTNSLVLEPNYEERTLSVQYTLTDQNGTSSYDGLVGGEFFDSFESVIDDYKDDVYEELIGDEKDVAQNYFVTSVAFSDGSEEEMVNFTYEDGEDLPLELETLRQLLDDISSLLLTEAPV